MQLQPEANSPSAHEKANEIYMRSRNRDLSVREDSFRPFEGSRSDDSGGDEVKSLVRYLASDDLSVPRTETRSFDTGVPASKRSFPKPFAPDLPPDIVEAILARGKAVPWRLRKVPRGHISGQEFFHNHYYEWIEAGIDIPGSLLRRADRDLYQQLYSELGSRAFPSRMKGRLRVPRETTPN
jgi:hypothetical protein